MFKEKITDVFFDLDHTLWDFEKNSALTFQYIFQKRKLKVDLDFFLSHYVPLNLKFWRLYREERIGKEELRYQRLRQSFDAIDFYVEDAMIYQLAEDYIKYLATFNNLMPGAIEILEYLKRKYRLHIITNGFAQAQENKMNNANIRSYFNVVINSEIAGVKKPNPKIFKMALNRAKVQAQNAVMIGDSLEADILGAIQLGFAAIHLSPGPKEEHEYSIIINYLNEIKNYL